MKLMTKLRTLAASAMAGLILAGLSSSGASAQATLTWDPKGSSPKLSTAGPFTFDDATIQDFASAYLTPTGPGTFSGTDTGFLPIVAFSLSGVPLINPGLNGAPLATAYGLFVEFNSTFDFTCTSAGNCTGTYNSATFSLLGNPGDHESFSFSATTGLPLVSGATSAFTLASGSLVKCLVPSPTCENLAALSGSVPTAAVTATFDEAAGESGFFLAPSAITKLNSLATFTNTTSEFRCYATSAYKPECGSFYKGGLPSGAPAGATVLIEIGINTSGKLAPGGGSITFETIPEPASLTLLGSSLLLTGWFARGRRNRKA